MVRGPENGQEIFAVGGRCRGPKDTLFQLPSFKGALIDHKNGRVLWRDKEKTFAIGGRGFPPYEDVFSRPYYKGMRIDHINGRVIPLEK